MVSTSSSSGSGAKSTSSADGIGFLIGILLGYGTFAYTFSTVDFILALTAGILIAKGHRPPTWSYLLLGALWIPSIGGGAPLVSIYWAGRIWLLAVAGSWVYRRADAEFIAFGFTTALLMQTLAAVPHLNDQVRGWVGLSWNLSVLSHSGLAALVMTTRVNSLAFITAVITLPVAGARSPLGAAVLWSVLSGRRAALIALVPILALFAWNHLDRLDPGTVSRAVETRAELLAREVESAGSSEGTVYKAGREREGAANRDLTNVSWYYDPIGFAGYNFSATPPKPHNIFVLLWYELGVFAAVPIILAVYAWRAGILPWQLLVMYAAYGLFVEAPVGRADGHFTVGVLVMYFAARAAHSKSPEIRT